MKTTQEYMTSIDEKLSELLNQKKGVQSSPLPPCSETIQETDSKFIKRRLTFVLVGTLSSMASTYLLYMNFLPLFNIGFGLMLAFICITLVILFDEFILPGDTIGKISQNPIGSAIVIMAFALVIIGGSQIGNGLITNRATAEEPTPERIETIKRSGQPQDSVAIGINQPANKGNNTGKTKEE